MNAQKGKDEKNNSAYFTCQKEMVIIKHIFHSITVFHAMTRNSKIEKGKLWTFTKPNNAKVHLDYITLKKE